MATVLTAEPTLLNWVLSLAELEPVILADAKVALYADVSFMIFALLFIYVSLVASSIPIFFSSGSARPNATAKKCDALFAADPILFGNEVTILPIFVDASLHILVILLKNIVAGDVL